MSATPADHSFYFDPSEEEPTMDTLDELAANIKATVVETCARVAEIHAIGRCENDFHRGYNQAVRDIAAKTRELNAPRKAA